MIYELLMPGAENAIPKADLENLTGLSDRELRRRVARERKLGFPILTDVEHGGYFAPTCPADVNRFIRSMRHRARETAAIADALEETLLNAVGQSVFEGWWSNG